MVEVKNRDAIAIYNFLAALRNKVADISLSPEVWKTLSDNDTKIESVVKMIDETRRELVRKHSDGNENEEGILKVGEGNEEKFRNEFVEVYEQTSEIDLVPIPLKSLGDTMQGEVGIIEFMKYMVN